MPKSKKESRHIWGLATVITDVVSYELVQHCMAGASSNSRVLHVCAWQYGWSDLGPQLRAFFQLIVVVYLCVLQSAV